MNPFPSDAASAPSTAFGGAEIGAGAPPEVPAVPVGPIRADAAEVRRLRARLLKLIQNRHIQRESQRARGLPFRGAG